MPKRPTETISPATTTVAGDDDAPIYHDRRVATSPARQRAVQLYRLGQRRSSARKRANHLRKLADHPSSPARKRAAYLHKLAPKVSPHLRPPILPDPPAHDRRSGPAAHAQQELWPQLTAEMLSHVSSAHSAPPAVSDRDAREQDTELTTLYDQAGTEKTDHVRPNPEQTPSWLDQALLPQTSETTAVNFSDEDLIAPDYQSPRGESAVERTSRDGESFSPMPFANPPPSQPPPVTALQKPPPPRWATRFRTLAMLPILILGKLPLLSRLLSAHAGASAPSSSHSPPADGSEKRQSRRIPYVGAAQLLPWPAKPRTVPIDVQVVDYSRTGVGILHDEGLIIGQQFILREPNVTSGSNTCMYECVRCDRRPDGRFSIGLHVCKPKEFAPEPLDEPPQRISRLMQWSFFLFAAIGTAVVLIITARRLR